MLVLKCLAHTEISCVTLGKSFVCTALQLLIHKAKTMPYRQVRRLLVTANSHDDGRLRGNQADMEIHLLQDPDPLGILSKIKPPTSKMATV